MFGRGTGELVVRATSGDVVFEVAGRNEDAWIPVSVTRDIQQGDYVSRPSYMTTEIEPSLHISESVLPVVGLFFN